MRDGRRRWDDEDIAKVVQLQKDGLTVPEIAERTGRTRASIYGMMHNRRQGGTLRFSLDEAIAQAQRIEWLFTHGVTIAELARIYEVSEPAISQTLGRLGLIEELRDEARLALPAVARTNTSHASRAA